MIVAFRGPNESRFSTKTALDQPDFSYLTLIQAVPARFYVMFYPEDGTGMSLTHIPTARLGILLLWFGARHHGSMRTTQQTQICSSGSDVGVFEYSDGAEKSRKLEYGGASNGSHW